MERKKYKKQKDTTPDLDKFLSDEKKRYISYDTVVLGIPKGIQYRKRRKRYG